MQGFNMGRYVPPDQEGVISGNQLAGKHALGARARHLHTTGALIVRFEMPFAVWCTTCKPHPVIIGQGVRFNAEKKKVGNYYSTPIYSFRMKHTACGGTIEIKTDPQNTAYVVTEGGRKRDTGEERELQPGEIAITPYPSKDAVEKDPFSKLEGKLEDKARAKTEASRILELQERQKRDWEDPYEKSMRLRRTFRAERKGLEKAAAKREAIKDKMSLGIELLDETETDRQKASMVEFGQGLDAAGSHAQRAIRARPMFEQRVDKPTQKMGSQESKSRSSRRPKRDDLIAARKLALRSELVANTRATIDPFLVDNSRRQNAPQPSIKKRKVITGSNASTPSVQEKPSGTGETSAVQSTPALVNYPSDSE